MGVYPLFLLIARFDGAGTGRRHTSEDRAMERSSVVAEAWRVLEPEIVEQGFELVEVEYGRFGGGGILRLFIDHEKGVTLDDCAAISQVVSLVLDKDDFIDEAYTLEVSSPGFDRPVRKPQDFARFAGERIKLKTVSPIEGRKRFSGVLRGIAEDLVTVETESADFHIHLANIQKANLDR